MASKKAELALRRRLRIRNRLRRVARGLHRLSVFRSNRHIYAQVINDADGITVVAASSREGGLGISRGGDIEAAATVGAAVAERARKAGVKACYFDRGSYAYHGRVRALADAARNAGLEF